MWFTSNVSAVVRRRSLLRGGLILGLLLLSLLILSCPEDDTESPTTSPTPAPEYELRHFQAMRDESQKWCAWLEEEDQVSLNVPHAGEFLVTLVTQQTTLRLVAQVHQASVLILWLQPTDRLVAATAQAGEIHAPGAANASVRSVHEDAYQFPQIWPASPYATLFAWPAHGGIGTWDQIFTPDPQTPVMNLAETTDGVLKLRKCPAPPTPTARPTRTPTPRPTQTPTARPTRTPIVTPTPIPTLTPTPTVTPSPTVTPPPTCHGILDEGACWYLSALNETCQATCQTQGGVVDTTVDAGGNFWDAHDAVYCRNLLVLLQHPNIAQSTMNLTMTSGYGLCGASNKGVAIKRDGGPHDTTQAFANGQVACPCR